jgi:16S rRNA (guanine966-N2)-methyltransferase
MNGKVRIISGQWRGRKLRVLDKPGLRPTQDRMRETLFNWLAMYLPGSRCLDLFAGSGALGIEAASRGAKQVILVEKDRDVVGNLNQHIATLGADNLVVNQADVVSYLKNRGAVFDIVFLDPPFKHGLVSPCCTLLEEGGWIAPRTYIYLEEEVRLGEPTLPDTWQVIRRQRAGQVAGFLVQR